MSIDLTTEISRIDEHDDKKEETPKAEDIKPMESTDEYDNTHVENSSVENMAPMSSTMVADEDRTESASDSISTSEDRAEMAIANDETAAAESQDDAYVAPDLSDAAMGYGAAPMTEAPTDFAVTADLGEEAIGENEDIPEAAPSEAIATPTLDDTIADSGSDTKLANESPVTLDLDDDAMGYDQKSPDKSVGEMSATLHSIDAVMADDEDIAASASMGVETATPEPAALIDDTSVTEAGKEAWQSLQINSAEYFETFKSATADFFKNNSQLFAALGVTFLAIVSLKLLFAGLNAIDDIPLVTPILKIVGLFYTIRFVWRYLIREHDRQELKQSIDRLKAEVLGS